MAGRPPKESIDFAGWNVDIFDNEPKIDKLIDAQGCIGFTTYFFLCQKAYGSNGYFYPWCFDDSATTARKIGGGASASSVEETVKLCFRVGLLNEGLYNRWKILTSRGIQKNYMKVALTRTNKSVISEYWLLSGEESEGLLKVALKQGEKRISPPHNSIMPPHNSYFSDSRVEDSIGEDSKVKKKERGAKRFAPPTLDEVTAYCHERGNNVDPQRFMDYFETSGWVDSKGNKVKNWKQKVITWEGTRTSSGSGGSSGHDDVFGRLKSETE